jgi:uncharacterized protein (TIGR02302 family)
MADRARTARAVEPDLKLASRDPFALRYVALTGLVMALIFGSVWRLGSVAALAPGGGAEVVADGPTWEGWLKPPAHSGKPTLYLNDQTAAALTLPAGTKLQLRLYGEPGSLILSETVSGRTEAPPASDPVQEFALTQSGKLAIEGPGGRDWEVTITPDRTPTIVAEGEISREKAGRFKQQFKVSDDYGVQRGQVTIALDLAQVDRRHGLAADPQDIAPVVLDLPLPRKGKREEFVGTLVDDLSQSVLANMPVTLTFAATDAAGQTGVSPPLSVTLPGKRFFDPVAAALIEMRRDLMWTRANAPRVVQVLRAITHQPEGVITNQKAWLRLRVAMKRLEADAAALSPELRDEVTEELWQIALLIEEGDLNDARERLKRAQDRLAEAIKRGAAPEEIQELMDEMRQAMDDYMAMLAENMEERTPEEQSADGGATMSQDQLQEMLDRLQKLMEEGKTAEAAELLAQIQEMMENMRMVQGQGQGQGQGGPASRPCAIWAKPCAASRACRMMRSATCSAGVRASGRARVRRVSRRTGSRRMVRAKTGRAKTGRASSKALPNVRKTCAGSWNGWTGRARCPAMAANAAKRDAAVWTRPAAPCARPKRPCATMICPARLTVRPRRLRRCATASVIWARLWRRKTGKRATRRAVGKPATKTPKAATPWAGSRVRVS